MFYKRLIFPLNLHISEVNIHDADYKQIYTFCTAKQTTKIYIPLAAVKYSGMNYL